MTLVQDHHGRYFFAQALVRRTKDNHLGNRHMVEQNLINFPGADLLAASVDDFLQASSDAEVALTVQHALIACAKPAVDKGIRIGLFIVFITRCDIGTANHNLPGFSMG